MLETTIQEENQKFVGAMRCFTAEKWEMIIFETGKAVVVEREGNRSVVNVGNFTESELRDVAFTLVPSSKRLDLRQENADFGIEYENEDGNFYFSVKVTQAKGENPYQLTIENKGRQA